MLSLVMQKKISYCHEYLRHLPVVPGAIIRSEEDIPESYNLFSDCYNTKSVDLKQYNVVVESMEDLRLSIVDSPSMWNWSRHYCKLKSYLNPC